MKISYEQEQKLTKVFLIALGISEEHAKMIGDVVTHADFTGTYSHGLSRFVMYLKQFKAGTLNPRPNIKLLRDDQAVVSYECDNCLGAVGVNIVYDEVLKRAKKYGISIGTAKHASNIGVGNYYGWKAAKDNMIGIIMANTVPAMAPFGGIELLIGTNPFIMACPAGEEYPMVLDMASSAVAYGKIAALMREGKSLPVGWALDKNGTPTTDPKEVYSQVPFAGHKGYGLAVMIEMMAALLSGACCGRDCGFDISCLDKAEEEGIGFSVILIDVEHFMPIDEFKTRVDNYVRTIKESHKAEGVDEIFLPGEIEYKKKAELIDKKLDISDALSAELHTIGNAIGAIKSGESLQDLINSL